jgi:hypothetical protein
MIIFSANEIAYHSAIIIFGEEYFFSADGIQKREPVISIPIIIILKLFHKLLFYRAVMDLKVSIKILQISENIQIEQYN